MHLFLTLLLSSAAAEAPARPAVGDPAPAFTLPATTGKDVTLAEFKGKNMLHDGDETPIGGHISHIRGVEALEKAIQLSGYLKPKPKNVGRGLSFS